MSEKKIEQFWRDATSADIAKVMRGENVEARFRDYEHRGWWSSVLNGWRGERESNWLDSDGAGWRFCQVYEPPQWYIDRPDPGEGWRLLEKFPPENVKPGDCFYSVSSIWVEEMHHVTIQAETIWYRRRIEPVKQGAGAPCASTIPKSWTALLLDEPRLASDAFWSQDAEAWIIIGDGWVEAANREKWPAIRQVETHKRLQLVAGYQYRLPSGASIIANKNGFEVL